MSDQGQASEGRLAMDTRLLPLTNPSTPPHLPYPPQNLHPNTSTAPYREGPALGGLVLSRVRFPRKDLLPASHLSGGQESPVLGFWKILAPAVKKKQYFTSGMVSYI